MASNLLLTWWVKGDLELAWLIGLPVILGGGFVFGAASATVLRRWRPALAAAAASVAWSAVLAYVAIRTPNHWTTPPPAALADAAKRLASDRAALTGSAEQVTGYPVEPHVPALVELTNSYRRKQGFSFGVSHKPGGAVVVASFDAGPVTAMQFDVIRQKGAWQLRPRGARREKLVFRRAAFDRRFPQASTIDVGGEGPYSPGDCVPVRIARSETDWDIVVFRVGDGTEVLREIRRYPRAELLSRFRSAVDAAGIGPLESAVIYFRPVEPHQVLFWASPEFSFIGLLGNPRYWRVEVVARLSGSELEFTLGRRLVRPLPGRPVAAGDRR